MIGPYQITQLVGGDGITEVYRGTDTGSGKPVTVKIVGRGLGGAPEFSARFRREARTVAALEHPNILHVLDFGIVEDGLYMVTEAVEGVSLTSLIDDLRSGLRSLNPADITFVFRQVAAALNHAHSQGVVHRAITPDTILITRTGQAMLTDFGLALLYGGSAEEPAYDVLIGPPEYKAPELLADPRAASPLSDAYALAIIVYELLTGQPPYVMGSDIDLVLRDLQDTAPDPRLLNPDIPATVALVLLKALARQPSERFRSAMQLANALERAFNPSAQPADFIPEAAARPPVGIGQPPAPSDKPGLLDAPEGRAWVSAHPDAPHLVPETAPDPGAGRAALIRLLAAVAAVALIGAAAVFLLDSLGVIDLPFGSRVAETGTPGSVTQTAPAATVTPTTAATVPPTLTVQPSPTALVVAEDTPLPEVEVVSLGIGTSAYRLADGAVMQFVPSGSFLMGTDDPNRNANAKPQHSVTLTDYWIDRTEVTNAQYAVCVAQGVCSRPYDTRAYDVSNRADHPVVYVNHTQAVTYCLWLASVTGQPIGLPTEAQWEKAAAWDPTAQVARRFPWGDESPSGDLARFAGSPTGGTSPAGAYPAGASAYGALDMAGNVWEWVADWFLFSAYQREGVPVDPVGPDTGTDRVMRGGGWANEELFLVSNVRTGAQPTAAGPELGFRCAMNGGQPPEGSGVTLTVSELIDALTAQLDAARGQPDVDSAALDQWQMALSGLSAQLASGQRQAALAIVEDQLEQAANQPPGTLIPPDLARTLITSLRWMQERLSAPRG
jgi:formylglycine-generating enzyme required for sulfatase activity